jgi:hypothetical protein
MTGALGFAVSEKFYTADGSRACFINGLGVCLELIESLDQSSGIIGLQLPGFLVFDVTRGCSSLEKFLQQIERRSGNSVVIKLEPCSQVIGSQVMAVATVLSPDSLPIDFCRREGVLPHTMRVHVDW